MAYTLNGGALAYGQPFTVADIQYSGIELTLWSREALAEIGVVWVEPETAAPLTFAQCLAALADLRWQKTQTMPSYDGATDVPADTARSVVTSKVLAAQFLTPEQQMTPQQFKLKPSEWRSWTVPDLVAYGMGIGAYMQLCFDHEADLEAQIRAAEDPASIDITTVWPG